MSDLPRFAVVGHPNKGKSSIVATLAEDDAVLISPLPGTTTDARVYPMRVDGETLYELIDTPGFQRPREVLDWLKRHERGAEARPAVLAEFVAVHSNDPRFHDECELLAPILAGAGILYVVDGAHPYGREYEAEMEVLRWSGQARMALINLIGSGDHVTEWRTALGQFFAIVRVFDAQRADFDKRVELLRAFGELHETWSAPLKRAVAILIEERTRRRKRAAMEIASLLCDVLTMTERSATQHQDAEPEEVQRLREALEHRVRKRERGARQAVEEIYQHGGVAREELPASLLDSDVFSAMAFSVFGLSNAQLAMTGAVSGAVAAGGVDLLLGGASLGLAAAAGAVLGGAGALLGAREIAKVRVLGQRLGGYELVVGPIAAPNFPWVLLGRAVLHQRIVAERNHARRETLVMDVAEGARLSDGIDAARRAGLERHFKRLRTEQDVDGRTEAALAGELEALLASAQSLHAARS
jgi:hypothetical protein